MTKALLEIKNLETFYGPIQAVRGITLEVEQGKITTILGGNGAGKTTILKTISATLVPQKGTITFEGKEIQHLEPNQIVEYGISHVPEGREIFPLLTVKENLILGAYLRKDRFGIQRDLALVYDYFPVLQERENQQAGYLSGGQQQMIAIGRALMARPKLMLLDEPSLGLSPLLVKEIFEIILRMNTEEKVSILLVEQNAKIALKMGSYGYVLEVGRIVMEDTCTKLLTNENIEEFYLGTQEEGSQGKRRWKKRKTWA